jgi:hypothetical protein
MAGDLVSLSYVVTNLAAGRSPSAISGYSAANVESPLGDTSGVPISGRMALFVLPALRIDPFRRTCYVAVDTFDGAASYGVSIDGNTVSAGAGPFATRAALITAWAAAINADVTVSAIVQADSWTGYDSTEEPVLRIRGKAGTSYYSTDPLTYSFNASATGSAVISRYADAESAEMRLYAHPSHTPPGGAVYDAGLRSTTWREIAASTSSGLARYAVGTGGMAMRMDCSGLQRVAAILLNVAGVAGDGGNVQYLARVDLTPCSLESTS